MERRKDKQTPPANTSSCVSPETLPSPSQRFKRKRNLFWKSFLHKLVLIWLVCICFLCVIYWLSKPGDYDDLHVRHEVYAQFDAMKDWIWEKMVQCTPILPPALNTLGFAQIKNPSFDNGLQDWITISGSPSTSTETLSSNSHWFAHSTSSPIREPFSCSSQLIDLTISSDILISDDILTEKTTLEMVSENSKKLLLFHGLIDYNSILINASASLRNPRPLTTQTTCGTRNHFCDRFFHDHIWFESELRRGISGEGRNSESRQLLGSLRSLNAEDDQWNNIYIQSLLPPHTRALEISVCNHNRLEDSFGGMADDFALSFHRMPKDIAGKHSFPCTITKQPMLRETGQGEGQITIIWETDNFFRSQSLDWGWEPGRTIFSQPIQTTFVDECHYIHKVEISYNEERFNDVIVGDRNIVFYRVHCGTTESDLYRYITPPKRFTFSSKDIEETRVAVISDNQYGSQVMRHFAYDIQSFHPDLLLMGGDIVNRGYLLEEWGMYFWYPLEVSQLAQQTPVVLTRGNHDGQSAFAFAYTAGVINRDWFAFSYGTVRYVILDSNADTSLAPNQLEWMKSEFQSKEFDDALFRVVMFHLPPFTELWSPKEGYNGEEFVRNDWVPLFEKHKVDLVISGHTHAYCRGFKNGVLYTIVGGAGGMVDDERVFDWNMFDVTLSEHHYVIMETDKCLLKWNVYNQQKEIIDTISLGSRTVPPHIVC